jgi:branched-subunit amino acid ABC-type transport system permease component
VGLVPHFAIIAVSILFDGLAYAMFLFITSVGLSVTMGLMGFVNLAHGAFAMAGGYIVVTLTRTLGVDFVPSLVIAAVVVGAVSVVFERGLYRRLYKSTDLEQVLLTSVLPLWRSPPRLICTGRFRNRCRCPTGCRATSISGSAISRAIGLF